MTDSGDPCPQCGEADLVPTGAKKRCPACSQADLELGDRLIWCPQCGLSLASDVWFQKAPGGLWYKRGTRQEKPHVPHCCDRCGKGFMYYKYRKAGIGWFCSGSCAKLAAPCKHLACNGVHSTRVRGRVITADEMCPAYRERRNAAERERQHRLRNNNPAWVESERARSAIEPSVYAVHFQQAGLLKVGFTCWRRSAISGARNSAKQRLGVAETPVMIWLRPGDYRHEAFVQAVLAFQFTQPSGGYRRMSEWFLVDSAEVALVALSDAYAAVPSQFPCCDPHG